MQIELHPQLAQRKLVGQSLRQVISLSCLKQYHSQLPASKLLTLLKHV